ncbi:MAG: hypothetical protein NPIRA02_33430 [Nitrospirales bacterium]|nr:MAG: hypothetical protein NPIRA02_33430 [Nitrospirales bacterium]
MDSGFLGIPHDCGGTDSHTYANRVIPLQSTWVEPKLYDDLFIHMLRNESF